MTLFLNIMAALGLGVITYIVTYYALSVNYRVIVAFLAKIKRHMNPCYKYDTISGIPTHFICNEKDYIKCAKIVASLPSEILLVARKENVWLSILSTDLFIDACVRRGLDRKESMEYAGMFYFSTHEILIDADSKEVADTIAHEFGHFCDAVIGGTSYFSEADPILTAEYNRHKDYSDINVPLYNRKNHQEFLAYCMSNFICNRKDRLTDEMIKISEIYLEAMKLMAKNLTND